MVPRLISRFAFARLRLTLTDSIARFAVTLAHSALIFIAKAKPRNFDLGYRDCDKVLPFTTDHFTVGDIFLQILFNLPFDDRPESGVITLDIIYHERFFTSPRAKILATKLRTSVEQI